MGGTGRPRGTQCWATGRSSLAWHWRVRGWQRSSGRWGGGGRKADPTRHAPAVRTGVGYHASVPTAGI